MGLTLCVRPGDGGTVVSVSGQGRLPGDNDGSISPSLLHEWHGGDQRLADDIQIRLVKPALRMYSLLILGGLYLYAERHTGRPTYPCPPTGTSDTSRAAAISPRPCGASRTRSVLLDEIEKADPAIFYVLLQVLDDGRLTDAQGLIVQSWLLVKKADELADGDPTKARSQSVKSGKTIDQAGDC